ncbi:hypothetical protein EV361DRAFT_60932 [Lentinula raphanica]|nr:hypothetical protein EV361DRAFT_60932 [Lentinula raphanica]
MREIFFFFVTALQPGAGFFFVLSILSLRSPTHPSWIVLVSDCIEQTKRKRTSVPFSSIHQLTRFLVHPRSSFSTSHPPVPITSSSRISYRRHTQTMRYDRTLIPFLTLSFALAAHSFPIPRPIPRPICSHDPNTDASTSTCTDTDTDTDIPLRFRRAAAAPTPNRRSSLDVLVPSDAADADKPLSPRLERRRKKRRGKGRNRPGNQQRGRQGSSAQGAPAVPVNGQASTPAPPSRPPPTMADSSTQVGAPSSNSASTSASAPSRGRPSNRAAAAVPGPGPVKPSMVDASTQIHPSSFDNHSLSRSSSVSSVSSSRSDASYASHSSTSSANTDLADYETSEDHAGGGPKDHRVAAQLYQHSNIPGVLPPQKPHMPVGADDEEGGEGGSGGGGGEGGDKKKDDKKKNKTVKNAIAGSVVVGSLGMMVGGIVTMAKGEQASEEAMQSNSDESGGSDSSLGSVSF